MIYYLAVVLFLGILIIAATWRIFKKAGTGGWKALIPIYSSYSLFKISWKTKYFWAMILLSVISGFLGGMVGFFLEYMPFFAIAQMVIGISLLVIVIKAEVKLAKAFGKGGGFAVGMIFLPFIFYPILGFGKAKFRRKKRRKKIQPAEEA